MSIPPPLPGVDFEMPLHFKALTKDAHGREYEFEKAILFEDILSVEGYPYLDHFQDIPHKAVIKTKYETIVVSTAFEDVYETWCSYRYWFKNKKNLIFNLKN